MLIGPVRPGAFARKPRVVMIRKAMPAAIQAGVTHGALLHCYDALVHCYVALVHCYDALVHCCVALLHCYVALVQRLCREQLALYRDILSRGAEPRDFVLTGSLEGVAMNFVALEGAYGLHLVAGGSITVPQAQRAIRLYAAQAGAAVDAVV